MPAVNNNTIGVFHRIGTQRQFNPVEVAARIKRFRDFYSDQVWDVRGFSYEGEQHTGAYSYGRKDINKLIADGGTGGFDPHFRHLLGGRASSKQRCGEAEHGGNESVAFDEFGCEDDTSLHELMHNGKGDNIFGLGHSHSIGSSGKIDKMGDHSSLMGAGHGEGLISPHIYAMGWNRPNETVIVTETQQVLIVPLEMAGLHQNEYKHVIIRVKGYNDFFLSTRQDWPFMRGDTHERRLYIQELLPKGHADMGDSGNATILHAALDEGDRIELPNGATVVFLGLYDGVARCDVRFNQEVPQLADYNFTLPTFGAPVESGCYYNPVSDGHGFDVHTHDGMTVIYWYTGNEDNEYPRFYYAYGKAGEEIDLKTTEGGTIGDPTTAVETVVGTCRFTGNTFCYRMEGIRGGIEVVQLVVPEASCIYYYPPRNGEGITVQEFDNRCAVFFYTYGPKAFGKSDTTQRWYSCEGVWNGAFYDLVMYQTRGRFMRDALRTEYCGKAQLIKLDTGQVRFSFQADGRDETYVMDKLF